MQNHNLAHQQSSRFKKQVREESFGLQASFKLDAAFVWECKLKHIYSFLCFFAASLHVFIHANIQGDKPYLFLT